jgi:hypothetical protein
MNGAGIDDAEGVRALARESIEKFAGKKSVRGWRKIVNGPFIFIWRRHITSCVSGRRRSGVPTLFPDQEFMLANGIPDCSSRCATKM